ncbi:Protein T05B9.2 [Aphelenchoides avenae]|nr:Protein T05B9.2 [Aphelenchus avenae]
MVKSDCIRQVEVDEACCSGIDSNTHSSAGTATQLTRSVRNASNVSRRERLPSSNLCRSLHLAVALSALFASAASMPLTVQHRGARCYTFAHGTTIAGADYRRDHGLTRKECAEVCKNDGCCLAFEWLDDACTLKSRSLNGTVETKKGATFGICIDYSDDERDRLWDHELGGAVVASKPEVARDECATFCKGQKEAIAYSWRTYDHEDVDAPEGHCECIEVLHHVRVSFGSFAGFLI